MLMHDPISQFIRDHEATNPVLSWCRLGDFEVQIHTEDKRYRNVIDGDHGIELREYCPDWIPDAALFGSSGWDVVERRSRWIGIDIDGPGKPKALTLEQLDKLVEACKAIPFIRVQRSKSGNGLHIFARFDIPPRSSTRREHKRLAKRLALLIEQRTGIPLVRDMDAYGTIMWLWSAKVGEGGFRVESAESEPLCEDMLPVLTETPAPAVNNVLSVDLDEEHRKIVERWRLSDFAVEEAEDGKGVRIIRLHTKAAEGEPGYTTNAPGDHPRECNAYAYPQPGGGFLIARYGGAEECAPWFKSSAGNWVCLYAVPQPIEAAARQRLLYYNGQYLGTLSDIAAVLEQAGHTVPIDGIADKRGTMSREGDRYIVAVEARSKDVPIPAGWQKSKYKLLYAVEVEGGERPSLEGKVYCGVRDGVANEWFTNLDDQLIKRSREDCRAALRSLADKETVEAAISAAAAKPWPVVRVPFQPAILADKLNPGAPQIAVKPAAGDYPTWWELCDHAGSSLYEYLEGIEWWRQKRWGGAQYIMAWIANALRHPTCRLPMLAMVGPQQSGKSTLAESLDILVPKGVYNIGKNIRTKDKFDAGLEGSPFVFADEVDMSDNGLFQQLKEWITSPVVTIRPMYAQAREVTNYTHWLSATNDVAFLPQGDDQTRIVILSVPRPRQPIEKGELTTRLRREAPAFQHALLTMELPPGDGRLALPAVWTDAKDVARDAADDPVNITLGKFLDEHCEDGIVTRLSEFASAFNAYCNANWSQADLRRALTNRGIRTMRRNGYWHVAGLSIKG